MCSGETVRQLPPWEDVGGGESILGDSPQFSRITKCTTRWKSNCPPPEPSFALALKRCGAAARLLESVSAKLNPLEELELTEMLWRIRNAAAALGVVVVEG